MTDSKTPPADNDAVLKIARGLIRLLQWLLILAALILTIALPCLFIFADPMLSAMTEVLVEKPDYAALGLMAALIAIGLVIVGLAYFAFNRLRRIVESVSKGDPFIPVNGVRLRGMGLAVLAIEAVSFVGALIATALMAMLGDWKPGEDVHIEIDGGISLSAVLLGLLLIVLARVFDRGAAMRAELEATI